ncbi:type IV pilin [Halopenitus sp. H-Gu1]|uniref:type IV pilin n=1 Tax=Halopenitus sp. H-Gu1 TaxID=3242697 RepID=UPI00359DE76B
MDLKQLLTNDGKSEERAVSPVIGVILMVAITVILAAVIGTFVLGLGDDLQDDQPTASFNFDFNAGNTGTVDITHTGGDTIDADTNTVTVTESSGTGITGPDGSSNEWPAGDISAGSSETFEYDGGTWSGETVSVNWESESGDSSATLAKDTAPE